MVTKKVKTPKINKQVKLEEKLKRALADYSNLEKRFAKESAAVIRFANSSLLQRMLEVKDSLERASETIKDEGIDLVLSQFSEILKEEEVQEIVTSQGFDPNTMECEEVAPGKKEEIIEIVQKGYILHDRVLRPVKVKLGNGQTK